MTQEEAKKIFTDCMTQSQPVINEKVKDMTNICMDFYQKGMFDMFNIVMKMLSEKALIYDSENSRVNP